jgi:hypothetical protein
MARLPDPDARELTDIERWWADQPPARKLAVFRRYTKNATGVPAPVEGQLSLDDTLTTSP